MSSFLAALSRQLQRPVSARSGRKEFIEIMDTWGRFQEDAVLPADTVAS
jgi:hypothetical protein